MNRFARPIVMVGVLLAVTVGLLPAAPPKVESIQWWPAPDTALEAAKKSNKLVLVEFTADWCHFCRKMEKETLADPKVAKVVNSCFVPVQMDADKYGELLQPLGIEGLPAMVVIDPQTGKSTQLVGYRTVKQLLKDLQTACPAPENLRRDIPVTQEDQPGRARVARPLSK